MLSVLYLDFNAYFASCEQYLQPNLRNKAVAVTPVLKETGCCIAASYEAKAYGVKTGTLVYEAKKLCPNIHVVESRPEKYIQLHHELVKIVDSCMYVEKVLSIDEMHCPLTGKWQNRDQAIQLAKLMKQRIAEQYGSSIRCSIGLSTNVFLAKTAGEIIKPDGLTIIEKSDIPEALYPIPLADLCGIGKAMHSRLKQHGIHTTKEMYEASRNQLIRVWGGIEGERMYLKLRGEELPLVESERKNISHSHVLAPHLRNEDSAHTIIHKLLQKAVMRMRMLGLFAQKLSIGIKYLDAPYWSDKIQFTETQDTRDFIQAFRQINKRRPSAYQYSKPIQVWVNISELTSAQNHTRSLFKQNEVQSEKLMAAIDASNHKLGSNSIYFMGAQNAIKEKAAPMRISFTQIPDLKNEKDS